MSTPRRQDLPLVGMLLGIWGLAYLAVFGFETASSHALLYRTWVIALALAVFLLTPFLVRRYFVWSFTHPRLSGGTRTLRRALAPMNPRMGNHIRERAHALGILEDLEIWRIPSSARKTNAYVWSAAGRHHLAFSSKAVRLFGASLIGGPHAAPHFQVLLDHELGHLWHADASLFLLGRAVVVSAVLLLPLKALLLFGFYPAWIHAVFDFSRIVPALTDGGGVYAGSGLFHPSVTLVLLAYALYTLACLTVLATLLRLMKRRRELLADQFALAHAPDKSAALTALAELLSQPAGDAITPLSFHGALNSHPSIEVRLGRARAGGDASFSDWEAALVVVLGLVIGRILLSDASTSGVFMNANALAPVSVLYVIAAAVLLNSCLNCDDLGRDLFRTWAVRALSLTGFGLLASTVLTALDAMVRSLAQAPSGAVEGLLGQIERRETLWLIWSLPLVLLAYSIAHLLSRAVPLRRYSTSRTVLQTLCAACITVALLWLTSIPLEPVVLTTRERDGTAIRMHLYDLIDENPSCLLPTHRRADEGCEGPIAAARMMEATDAQILHMRFRPPLSWILLWEQPFRRPPLIA